MDEDNCIICYEKLDTNFTECNICNINMHNECERQYRGNNTECKCPHCQRKNTIIQKTHTNTNTISRIDALLDPLQYTKLDHKVNNENIYSNLPLQTVLYYIEKNFTHRKKNWYIVDCIVTHIDPVNKQIGTYHPGKNGEMYIGVIYYGKDNPNNLVDYYVTHLDN